MHILEQRDTLVLTNGDGSPRRDILIQAAIAIPISLIILLGHVSAAMNGWTWGWLALLIIPPADYAMVRSWRRLYHATLIIDRRFGRVQLERRFAYRTEQERLSLSDVQELGLEVDQDGEGDDTFAPVLAMKDGRRIGLGPKRYDRASMDRAVEAVRGAL